MEFGTFAQWSIVILQVLTLTGIALMKFNDLRHLSKDVDHLKDKQEEIAERVAKIEGKLG